MRGRERLLILKHRPDDPKNDPREEKSMSLLVKLKPRVATIVAGAAAVAVAGLLFASGASTQELKSYDSSKKDFWLHPPDDWFMGDEFTVFK